MLTASLGATLAAAPGSLLRAAPVISAPEGGRYRLQVEELLDSKYSPRPTFSQAYVDALSWAQARLDRLSYTTTLDVASIQDGYIEDPAAPPAVTRTLSFDNLEAVSDLNPAPSAANPTYIVCAHLDTTEDSPGANDNSTGVAAVMELAYCFKDINVVAPRRGVRFVLFGGEEMGLLGSRHYAKALAGAANPAHFRIINFDTLGAQRGKSSQQRYVMESRDAGGDLRTGISNEFYRSGEMKDRNLRAARVVSRKASDHLSFYDPGSFDFPVVSISQSAEYFDLHSGDDNLGKVDFDSAFRAVQRVHAFLRKAVT